MASEILTRLPLVLLAATLASGLAACGDDDDDGGGDTDTDTDTDTSTDTGGDECTAPYEWGGGFAQGQVIGNWELTGYIDDDGDGVVEQEEVDFNMDYLYCAGVESVVLAVNDVT